MLKKFTLRESVDKDFVMSLFAPKVENLSWSCSVCFYPETVVIDASGMWRLDILKLETQESGFVLSLHVGRPVHFHSFDILLLFYVQLQSPGNSDELFNCYYELSFGVLHLTCDFHALTEFCNTYAKLARNVPAS